MSTPARRLPASASPKRSSRARTTPSRTSRTPARRPTTARRTDPGVRVRGAAPVAPRRRARRPILSVVLPFLVGALLLGTVAMQVVAAQTALQIDAARDRIELLADEQRELLRQQATLSAPGRIADWAQTHGMEIASGVRILTGPVGG